MTSRKRSGSGSTKRPKEKVCNPTRSSLLHVQSVPSHCRLFTFTSYCVVAKILAPIALSSGTSSSCCSPISSHWRTKSAN